MTEPEEVSLSNFNRTFSVLIKNTVLSLKTISLLDASILSDYWKKEISSSTTTTWYIMFIFLLNTPHSIPKLRTEFHKHSLSRRKVRINTSRATILIFLLNIRYLYKKHRTELHSYNFARSFNINWLLKTGKTLPRNN